MNHLDQDGKILDTIWNIYSVASGIYSAAKNTIKGNFKDALLDVVGVGADLAAVVVPGVPAVGSTAVKAIKTGDNLVDAAKVLDKANDIVDAGKVAKSNKPYSKSRPKYAKGQVEEVWERAKDEDGLVRDPYTKEVLTWDKSKPREWDMRHRPEEKYSEVYKKYMDGEMSLEDFLKWYRNPDNYRPLSRYSNRSHKYEGVK